jgi:cytochrome c peroxidase
MKIPLVSGAKTTLAALPPALLGLVLSWAPVVVKAEEVHPPPLTVELTPMELLGRAIYFDANLSSPAGISCASCHDPASGWTSSDPLINEELGIYHGSLEVRFGNRKAPTAAYADAPPLFYDEVDEVWVGGSFWDGRATGAVLGDPLAEQAMGPFLNPVEQNIRSARQVILKIKQSKYAGLFEQVWGPGSLDHAKDVAGTYVKIAKAIAAYERSAEVNPFSSKYDAWLNGQAVLTSQEELGRQLFNGKGQCNLCHTSEPGPDGSPPLFTDFTYDNLGIPKNPVNPFYTQTRKINPDGADWVDYGLGGFLASAGYPEAVSAPEMGKHKVPTLRNVDQRPEPGFVKAYGHNGFFKSLEEFVSFYNTRDVPEMNWPAPEVPATVNTTELGNLGLTPTEESALVAFLKTLSDGYTN